jgi:hypothetical protein
LSKTVRRLLVAVVIFGVGVAYCWVFGFQTLMILETRYLARRAPVVKKTPTALPIADVSTNPGTKLSFLGYQFEVPWDDIDTSRTRHFNNLVSVGFRSGRAVLISSVPPRDFVRSVMSMFKLDAEGFRHLFGEQAFQSDYELKRAIFESTPSSVTLFTPIPTIVSRAVMLIMKAVMLPGNDTEIYTIRSGNFKGFQIGNPASRPSRIALQLCAEDGELDLTLAQRKEGPPPGIAQAEINRIIQTARRTDAKSKKSDRPASGTAH